MFKHNSFNRFCFSSVLLIAALSVSSGVLAQQPNPTATQTPPQATAQKLPAQPFDHMFELPAGVLQALALETKQKELLDKAHMARRQLWSAMRNARLEEYAALSKALDKDPFDPKEVISLRKKIRLAADKRMDEVQEVWMDFWESLSVGQRKTLVNYMKQQHVNNATLSRQRAAQEKAANPPAQPK